MAEGDVKAHVRATYGEAARRVSGAQEPPGCGCAGRGAENGLAQRLYGAGDLVRQPPVAVAASLGCGNPAARAEMAPGEVVLDLGSGGGLDAFIAAKRVGSSGRVIGLDMTDEMLELARRNQVAAGVTNVEFLKGDIEAMPFPDASVDLVISNCVINLATDKQQVFREAFRVLRPGGRLAVSDMVFQGDPSRLPEGVLRSLDAWAGCVAGALEEGDYRAGLAKAGFTQITLEADDGPPPCEASACCGETTTAPSSSCVCSGDTGGDTRPRGDATDGVRLVSGFIQARKPDAGPWRLRQARPEDSQAVRRILGEAGLPEAGVADQFSTGFAVAVTGRESDDAGRGPEGTVIGVAGVEVHRRNGLLRSVAVDGLWRGVGVGETLTRDRIAWSAAQGLEALYLLTDTAAGFFGRLGFEPVDRSQAPAEIRRSSEFTTVCRASGMCLRRRLEGCG